ncbi:MAG: T9SS type A sorting domain-containing protein [Flavobacteriales bacterium]
MNKKLLSFGAIILAFCSFNLNAQLCTPDPQYANADPGIFPDTLTNLPCAFGNQASYEAVIDLKTITDTTLAVEGFGTLTAYISAFRIAAVNGLPPNFSYIPNVSEWTNTGNAPNFQSVQGCISISANQAAVQAALNGQDAIDFPIEVRVDVRIHSTDNAFANALFNFPAWLSELTGIPGIEPFPINGYRIRARATDANGCVPLSANNLMAQSYQVEGNFPNPFNQVTQIVINSDRQQLANLQVYNTMGALVHQQQINLNQGRNSVDFDATNLTSGVYYYSVMNAKGKITKTMMIAY